MPEGPLPVIKHPKVERVLRGNGFEWTGGKGSHRKYQRGRRRVIVPCHSGQDIPPGTLNNIVKSAGKSRDEFR